MDVAGKRDVGNGLGEMVMMHVYLFLIFIDVAGAVKNVKNAWVETDNTKHGVSDSGPYWHESTVFAGVQLTRSSACKCVCGVCESGGEAMCDARPGGGGRRGGGGDTHLLTDEQTQAAGGEPSGQDRDGVALGGDPGL